MWLPQSFVNIFTDTRDELIKVRTERDNFRDELAKANILVDWFRMQVNQLQAERSGLIERAYNIKLPVPEIVRASKMASMEDIFSQAIFEDIDNPPVEPTQPVFRPNLG